MHFCTEKNADLVCLLSFNDIITSEADSFSGVYMGSKDSVSKIFGYLRISMTFLGRLADSDDTTNPICSASNNNTDLCGEGGGGVVKDWPAMGAVFFGIFLAGWGGVAIYSLGVPYVDDNSGNNPVSIAIAIASR